MTTTVDEARQACLGIDPVGFHIRHPPPPHQLSTFITPDDKLFQTIHMGPAVVDESRWQLVIDGLVKHPFSLSLKQLQDLPTKTVISCHECYGSPLTPPVKALWRIGNVRWTGVPLCRLIEKAEPLPGAQFVWSEGLDCGEFAGRKSDRYQKDLPLDKAVESEVLIAYQMNDEPLSKLRGGPVRLVVPGWFGTNSTKWLFRLSLQSRRAPGLFTTLWYNEQHPDGSEGQMRPVWKIEPNSMIVSPRAGECVTTNHVSIHGWAWSCDGVSSVSISSDNGATWIECRLEKRKQFSWQGFQTEITLSDGTHTVIARATSVDGIRQPLKMRRNHVHKVEFDVRSKQRWS